jgi:hypothetical protein
VQIRHDNNISWPRPPEDDHDDIRLLIRMLPQCGHYPTALPLPSTYTQQTRREQATMWVVFRLVAHYNT